MTVSLARGIILNIIYCRKDGELQIRISLDVSRNHIFMWLLNSPTRILDNDGE